MTKRLSVFVEIEASDYKEAEEIQQRVYEELSSLPWRYQTRIRGTFFRKAVCIHCGKEIWSYGEAFPWVHVAGTELCLTKNTHRRRAEADPEKGFALA